MLEDIKKWSSNFFENQVSNDNEKLFDKNNFRLNRYKSEGKQIYLITGDLPKRPSEYIQYLWDKNKIKSNNKNIVEEINLIKEKENFKEYYTKLKFCGIDNSIKGCDKKESLYLEENDNGFNIYGILDRIITDEGYIHIEDGFVNLQLIEYEGKTQINYLIEFESNLPNMIDLIPGIVILKTLTNLNNV